MDRIQQIGNSVPVKLGEVLGRHLAKALKNRAPASNEKGRLLSFVPTLAEGRSPALSATCRMVERRFPVVAIPELWEEACR